VETSRDPFDDDRGNEEPVYRRQVQTPTRGRFFATETYASLNYDAATAWIDIPGF